MKNLVAAAVAGGVVCAGCGAAGHPDGVQPAGPSSSVSITSGTFVQCSAIGGRPTYAIVNAPGPGCMELVAGRDYADGRVIVGLKAGTTDAQLSEALAAYDATVISSQPALGYRVLAVPNGSVPQAVVGLSTYPFVSYAAPDMLNHIDPSKV